MMKPATPELLAPAGDMSAALAAFDAGADAVYAGLAKFSARERARNFSLDAMSRLIAEAGRLGKKVYAALNTIVKESELEDFAETAAELASLNPSAVIVQDLAAVRFFRECFPKIPVHASTQMGIHNSAGAEAAARMGIKRVILERQLTFGETEEITRKSPLETEIFVHGALCCGLSGLCLFSSWTGGWSGNRGRCKQPCRREYLSEDGQKSHCLSPRDLYLIDSIPAIKKLGISSLKIEGRLKRADYVFTVVSAYRAAMDSDESSFPEAQRRARDILRAAPGRSGSAGFPDRNALADMIDAKSPPFFGVPKGLLLSVKPGGAAEIRLAGKLHTGDIVRLKKAGADEDAGSAAFTITGITVGGAQRKEAFRGEICEARASGRFDAPPGTEIFKTGQSFGGMEKRAAALPRPLFRSDISVSVTAGELSVTAELPGGETFKWRAKTAFPSAEKRPSGAEAVSSAFDGVTGDGFALKVAEASVQPGIFIPASEMKKFRKEFAREFAEAFRPEKIREAALASARSFVERVRKARGIVPRAQESRPAAGDIRPGVTGGAFLVSRADDIRPGTEEVMLPYFIPEDSLGRVRRLAESAHKQGIRRFRVTSLCGLILLKGLPDISVTASYPLCAANSAAALELLETFGVKRVMASPELDLRSLDALVRNSAPCPEIFRRGLMTLLATRALPPVKGKITDARGGSYFISLDYFNGLTVVTAEEVLELPEIPGAASFFDFAPPPAAERAGQSSFNLHRELL